MTAFDPAYGETPVDPDDLAALTPTALEILGNQPTRASLYDLEQQVLVDVGSELLGQIAEGDLELDEVLTDYFLRDLHERLYGDFWTWAGAYRRRELSIGVAPEAIASELRVSLDNLAYRWANAHDLTPRILGMAVHADTVRVHPFTDGNGRTTRLFADLVFLAAQDAEVLFEYDWSVDKPRYIDLLRQYDVTRDARPLAEFVPIVRIA